MKILKFIIVSINLTKQRGNVMFFIVTVSYTVPFTFGESVLMTSHLKINLRGFPFSTKTKRCLFFNGDAGKWPNYCPNKLPVGVVMVEIHSKRPGIRRTINLNTTDSLTL